MSQPDTPKPKSSHFWQAPLLKTTFYGLIWALAFAWLLPANQIEVWQYSFFISALPAILVESFVSINTPAVLSTVSLVNLLILYIPYWFYRKHQVVPWKLYWGISLYAFLNAALAFSLIMDSEVLLS